jgi:hypothetical protein
MFEQQTPIGTPESEPRSTRWPWLVAIVWIVAVLAGLETVWNYANTPAQAVEPRSEWMANSQISLDSDLPTLVMFAHPHCPCTRASVAELARIAAQGAGRFVGWVVLFKPGDAVEGWEQGHLMRSAEEIPGVHVVTDRDGQLARLFHITTSGHTLLYNPRGKLLFSGGITSARGHAGDNVGESAIVSLLGGLPAKTSHTPVFGCPIIEDSTLP